MQSVQSASTGLNVNSTAGVMAIHVIVIREAAGAHQGRSAPPVSSVVQLVGLASTAPRRAAVVALPPFSVALSPENVCARPDLLEICASMVSWP